MIVVLLCCCFADVSDFVYCVFCQYWFVVVLLLL